VAFLLLLAVADDAVGLGIIAIFYGDPLTPAAPEYLALVALAMGIAYALRRFQVRHWPVYIFIAGSMSWVGLVMAHLHPALALAVVVPFLPAPRRDTGMFAHDDEVDRMGEELADDLSIEHAPLHIYEHQTKVFVDFGLFFFAYCNAGVELASMGTMTWLVLGALVIGKTLGVTMMGLLARRLGFPLPVGMSVGDLVMAGFVASLGLTVALFVATAAFSDPLLQGQAKMGALFSGFVGLVAIALGKLVSGKPGESSLSGSGTSEPGPSAGGQSPEAISMSAERDHQ